MMPHPTTCYQIECRINPLKRPCIYQLRAEVSMHSQELKLLITSSALDVDSKQVATADVALYI